MINKCEKLGAVTAEPAAAVRALPRARPPPADTNDRHTHLVNHDRKAATAVFTVSPDRRWCIVYASTENSAM